MATEILLTVQEPSTLNEFLRQELPEALQVQDDARTDCVQGQNAASEKAALSNSKIRRLLFSGNVMVAPDGHKALKNQKARQAQERGGFFV